MRTTPQHYCSAWCDADQHVAVVYSSVLFDTEQTAIKIIQHDFDEHAPRPLTVITARHVLEVPDIAQAYGPLWHDLNATFTHAYQIVFEWGNQKGEA